jgi:hypothetical protein
VATADGLDLQHVGWAVTNWVCCVCINLGDSTQAQTMIDGFAVCGFHAEPGKHAVDIANRFSLAGSIALGLTP